MHFYPKLLRPALDVLGGFDRERAHHRAIAALRLCGLWPLWPLHDILSNSYFVRNDRTVFGIRFPNPVGTAAGFDKRGVALRGIEAFGFGFAEVGTVTPRPQPGNPRPRLFRLDEDEAIINRMGFNSEGMEVLKAHLASSKKHVHIPVGINLGKNKDTPLENAADDYEKGLETLYSYADYFAVNVSSPNTPELRLLQGKGYLEELLQRVQKKARACAGLGATKPVLLKIAPDLTNKELDEILESAERHMQGLIIGNTTVARPDSLRSPFKHEAGGLSGTPLRQRTLELVRYVHRALPGIPIVGVGGISTPEQALRMFDAGASLIQLYTGLVFEGPLLPYRINRALRESIH
jgi:dihydroorotate dehydrogenase